MSTITVRQAVLSDLDVLASLFDRYRQFYGQTSNVAAAREFLLARFNHGESVLLIAFDDSAPVGFVQLYPSFSSVSLARIFILNDLFVSEHCRKKGVGSRLIQAAIGHARILGAARLSLSTAVTNQTAQAVYEATGWQRDKQFFYYEFPIEAQPIIPPDLAHKAAQGR
ncbi:MAG: GNAT family N-acetyltransferase [Candidatus Contendobacter sp.]|nr:GNAT family N-acetyltransferase [Candidatus Contendobacter sp.]